MQRNCGICEVVLEIPLYCMECRAFLCQNDDKEMHSIGKLREHTRIEGKDELFCTDHNNIIPNFFCVEDSKPLCDYCLTSGHKGHNIIMLNDKKMDVRDQLAQRRSEIVKRLKEEEEYLASLQHAQERLRADAEEFPKITEREMLFLIEKLSQRLTALKSNVGLAAFKQEIALRKSIASTEKTLADFKKEVPLLEELSNEKEDSSLIAKNLKQKRKEGKLSEKLIVQPEFFTVRAGGQYMIESIGITTQKL
eukprot:TRINITY_DN4811_c0_g1_i2.p1 TRINITY_DN4811_c0_g1~~TRINITY_DN4811_c0_g1_i2.p1  ORF type:complete len:251 (-),score=49.66 TRINITY_DN4811_c0_g1_i2:32-784(-)